MESKKKKKKKVNGGKNQYQEAKKKYRDRFNVMPRKVRMDPSRGDIKAQNQNPQKTPVDDCVWVSQKPYRKVIKSKDEREKP
jgi:hypothetical protein